MMIRQGIFNKIFVKTCQSVKYEIIRIYSHFTNDKFYYFYTHNKFEMCKQVLSVCLY